MNILNLEKITKAFGARKILDEISFYLEEGEKVGILGINGTGKSTLLKIIAGLEECDEGKYVKAEYYRIRFLPQAPSFDETRTVLEAVLKDNPDKEVEAKTMLTKLGVRDFSQPCGQLSGGQRKRLALVSVLVSDAQIVVLDEPTNHLDHQMSEWLEEQLRKRKGAVVMVTHDRYFLDSVSTRIVELSHGKLYSYDSNYSGYLELKLQREEMEMSTFKKRQNLLRNELLWVRRGAQARSTKQKARLQRFEQLSSMEDPRELRTVALSSVASRLGRTTVELNNLTKSYDGRMIINDFTYYFLKNDRVGFVGPNGSGKTTLMKMIVGDIVPDSGHVEIGQTVRIGYFAQELDDTMMHPKKRVIDYISDVAEYIETPDGTKITAARLLENFLFEGEDQYGLLGKLSGGERRRLYLCKILMSAPNVLILDEPTNDLDIATLQILEDYLDTFSGIVIIVSHDRYFLDRTVQRIFALEEDGSLTQYEGGYTDYVNRMKETGKAIGTDTGSNAGQKRDGNNTSRTDCNTSEQNRTGWKSEQKKKLKFTYLEQKDYETIEDEIINLEEQLARLEEDYNSCGSDFVKLNHIMAEKEEKEKELEAKMDRWMYLEKLAERIKNGEWA